MIRPRDFSASSAGSTSSYRAKRGLENLPLVFSITRRAVLRSDGSPAARREHLRP